MLVASTIKAFDSFVIMPLSGLQINKSFQLKNDLHSKLHKPLTDLERLLVLPGGHHFFQTALISIVRDTESVYKLLVHLIDHNQCQKTK
jgi:hypothetical protein